MTEPHDLHDELHRHAGGLRHIARDLLRDPHLADDVAQQTLQAALTHPGLRPGPLGGWLQRTLGNFVLQWRRGERRRAARHAALPVPEPAPATLELLGRRETLQAVTQAVLSLEEPYQTAIFLRYFEDLPPRAIARRTGTNLATVKSRLHRGLVLLRERLDQKCGDRAQWRLALLGAFGLPLGTVAAGVTLTTGAWLVSTTTKTLVAAGVLCAGGLFYYSMGQEPPPAAPALPKDAPQPGPAATTSAATGRAEGEVREAASAAAPAANDAWLDHPYTLELEVQVVDAIGLPVEGRRLRLAPTNCTLDDADKSTGEDGKVLLSWPSRQPNGEVVIADERGTLRRATVQHGRRTQLVLAGRSGGGNVISFRMSGNNGLAIQGNELRLSSGSGGGVPVLSNVPVLGRLFTAGQGGFTMQEGLHPFARFGTKGPEAKAGPGPDLAWSDSSSFTLSLDGASFQIGGDESGKPRPQLARVAGTVFGEDGKPAKKVPVVLLGEGGLAVKRGETDEQGIFAFEELLPASFTVRAGGTAAGLATAPAPTTTGTTPVTLNLQRGSCVRGRAVGADKKPLAGARIVWRAADGSWWDTTDTQKDGTFVLANLPASGGTVIAWTGKQDEPLRALAVPAVLNDTGELVLQEPEAKSTLKLDPQVAEGAARQAAEVRVWQLDTGLGAVMQAPEGNKPWQMGSLPAGFYRVELFTAGGGWQDLGKHWIDGAADCDLGRVAVNPPAVVEFDLGALGAAKEAARSEAKEVTGSPGKQGGGTAVVREQPFVTDFTPATAPNGVELYQVRPDLDIRLQCGDLPAKGTLEMPAGDFVLAFRRGEGPVQFQRFTTRAGGHTTLTLPK